MWHCRTLVVPVVLGALGTVQAGIARWRDIIILDWGESFQVGRYREIDRILGCFKDILGELRGIQATIHVHPDTPPRFFKARKVPYALREKLEDALFRM